MEFELTDSVYSKILFAMEDQTQVHVLNTETLELEDFNCIEKEKASKKYVELPEWTSADGFSLLEDFTSALHSPVARMELKQAINSGRGVFRNYKNVLKAYPDIERRFNLFKKKRMNDKILEWYNSLREVWGLEKIYSLDETEDLDTEELVVNDFQFRNYDFTLDEKIIDEERKSIVNEIENQEVGGLGKTLATLGLHLSSFSEMKNKIGIMCYSHEEEFAGCVLFSFCPNDSKRSVLVTDFFVSRNYRGLGIGKELLLKGLEELKKHDIQWVVLTNTNVPVFMESTLLQFGFEKRDSCFVIDLFM